MKNYKTNKKPSIQAMLPTWILYPTLFLLFTASCGELKNLVDPDASTSDASSNGNETHEDGGADISCEGVTCFTPDPKTCTEDGSLEVFTPPGWCDKGQCKYESRIETCDEGTCVDGACIQSPCQGIICNTPPKNTCSPGGAMLLRYDNTGYCTETDSGTSCEYSHTEIACAETCENGVCTGEPCESVVCEEPLASYCKDNSTLVHWTGEPGQCTDGKCGYSMTERNCLGGCTDGKCSDDPCEGVTCTTPLNDQCDGGDFIRHNETGTCTDGTCYYAYTVEPNAQECCPCQIANECCDGCKLLKESEPCEDDGFTCTEEVCDTGVCKHNLQSGYCLIDSVCYQNYDDNPPVTDVDGGCSD